MVAEAVDEWSNAATPDERHDYVDRVGRLDLRSQLIPQAGFPRRIGEKGRIEERDKRFSDLLWRAVGSPSQDGVQHLCGINQCRSRIGPYQLTEPLKQSSGQLETDLDSIVVADVSQSLFDIPAELPGNSVGSLGGPKGTLVNGQAVGQSLKLRF